MRRFWNWVRNETNGERTLYLNGPIAEESWLGDEVTPALFKEELMSGSGPVTVFIHSPGGDVFAAAQIYNMLMEYAAPVTVKIDGIAASAASVVAMAGGEVYMSPVSMMMLHNPATLAWGDSEEMRRAKSMLDEVKESLINAYQLKTGLSRAKLSNLMDNETWMNAHKAMELGFADKIMYAPDAGSEDAIEPGVLWNRSCGGADGMLFSAAAVTNSLLGKLPRHPVKTSDPPVTIPTALDSPAPDPPATDPTPPAPVKPTGTPIESLDKRLSLLLH